MLYEIKKDGLFLSSNGQYVNQSGVIGDGTKPVKWVSGSGNGMGTTSFEQAKAIADIYGGEVVEVSFLRGSN
jgi:hypothetical protein